MQQNNYSFYVLKPDISPDEIRYVGVTTQKLDRRFSQHKYCANHPEKRGLPVHKWMYSVYKNGGSVIIEKIDECSEEAWEAREQYWISYYKNLGHKLMNIDKGGKGVITKEKRSIDSLTRAGNAHKKPITAFNLDGTKYKDFYSITEAAAELNGSITNIDSVLNGNSKSACGFIWKYKTEEEKIDSYKKESIGIKIYQFDLYGNLLREFESKKCVIQFLNKNSHHALDKAIKNKTEYKRFFWALTDKINISEYVSPFKYKITKNGEEVIQLIEQKEVAEYLCISKSAVNQWLKKYNGSFSCNNYIVDTI
jgi:hypothetical protein